MIAARKMTWLTMLTPAKPNLLGPAKPLLVKQRQSYKDQFNCGAPQVVNLKPFYFIFSFPFIVMKCLLQHPTELNGI